MKILSSVIVLSHFFIFSSFAYSVTSSTKIRPEIDAKLSIAYASIMLVHEGGANANEWLAVQTKDNCRVEALFSKQQHDLTEGKMDGDKSMVDPSPNCYTSVYFTTKKEAHQCADGTSVYSHSGDGVTVFNATQGEFFKWDENASCPAAS